jgi:hypothetical protein
MSVLVGVHGIATHQLGRHQLLAAWSPALADGLERACGRPVAAPALDLAFYGDLFLKPGPAQIKSAIERPELDDMDGDEWAEIERELVDAATARDIAAAEDEVPKAYTRMPRAVRVLLRAVDRRFGAAAGILHVSVLRQVRRYLTEPQLKAQVDARVAQVAGPACRVMIAHSLGSVVAYEYLRRNPDSGVELFLTLGSPLGLRMVRQRLESLGPVPVASWVNVYDLGDPVACAGALNGWWPQIGADGDVVVVNGGDTHAVRRYLSREATGQILLGALPHLVAR